MFISAAEPSADRHGADLIHATSAARPGTRFVGVAGPRMVAAGCQSIYDMSRHSAMLLGALRIVGRGIAMLNTSEKHLRRYPFDAAVVIDSPTLHLPLARRAHALGIPVLYYIAPQLWAWGARRIHRLRNDTDHVAVILPFEEAFFRERGVKATFVGHPLARQLADCAVDTTLVRQLRVSGEPVVALLPGSRKHVVEAILPGQMEVAAQIARAISGATFCVSIANDQVAPVIHAMVSRAPVSITPHRQHAELIVAADLALVASGTTTLEVAFHRTPMIVMYRSSRLFYHLLGRWMIRTKHLSLPNILAGRRIVPEFMPYYRSTGPIGDCALELLRNEEKRRRMVEELEEVVGPLRGDRAAENTARILIDLIDQRGH